MQISDIHVGRWVSESFLRDALQKSRAIGADLIVYTGDYVHYRDNRTLERFASLADELPLGRQGTLAILGNHDYGHGWNQPEVADRITRTIEAQGIRVLRNERLSLDGLEIVGIDDYWGTYFDPGAALRGCDPGTPSIALCHNPDVCDLNVWQGYQGWILSGHTHGGQCRAPLIGSPVLPVENKDYTSGHFDLGDGRQLYINRALGHLYRVRFMVRPEITIFELRPA